MMRHAKVRIAVRDQGLPLYLSNQYPYYRAQLNDLASHTQRVDGFNALACGLNDIYARFELRISTVL